MRKRKTTLLEKSAFPPTPKGVGFLAEKYGEIIFIYFYSKQEIFRTKKRLKIDVK
ncbi:MAG: hypothetical protein GF329_01605 [Candidatus Lokiarchaeota archaeon]|nr:hypothetical protein [Candidatus Lokiarchaeota archaeon]